MTTMLERAAISVAACLTDAPVPSSFSMADVNGWTEDKSYEIARAVLMAVRVPSGTMHDRGDELRYSGAANYGAGDIFTAMIDSILSETAE